MSGHYPPLTYSDVVSVLKHLGFEQRKTGATSHEQWVRRDQRGFFKVTVDKPKQPFTGILIASMARQAGLSKREFYRIWRSL